jgi:membrane protease subunit HflC
MGISVTEFGFKRVAFPEENTPAVLSHMRAERNAEANRLRAEGEKEAQTIRNEALVRNEEILSEGRKKAGEIRGNGEREAAQIYAQSESRDPRFYRYWRSLEASKKVMSSSRSTIVLRTDQSPFDALGEEKP